MLVHWIWLATRPGLKDSVKADLVRRFLDPETVFFADSGSFADMENLTRENLDALADKDLRPAMGILEECRKAELRVLTYRDVGYPARLRNITDPPLVFYYKGRVPDFDAAPVIGVVGTRQASPYCLPPKSWDIRLPNAVALWYPAWRTASMPWP